MFSVLMVYDNRDRLVLTQDGNMRSNEDASNVLAPYWLFTKYDGLNRPVMTGKYFSGLSRSGHQAIVDDLSGNGYSYSESQENAVVYGYTNNVYPNVVGENKYLTVTYYDDYSFMEAQDSLGL